MPVPDPRTTADELLTRGPVHREAGGVLVVGHAEVLGVVTDPETFSSRVSRHLQIPNGLDGDTHRAFRRLVDSFLDDASLAPFVPAWSELAEQVVAAVPRGAVVDAVADLGVPFAVRAQTRWLGWPVELEPDLVAWVAANRVATRSGDHRRTAEVAEQFDAMVRRAVDHCRNGDGDDVTTCLARSTVDGRDLADEEIVSILRNWTGGDLASMAASIGVVLHSLAESEDLQDETADALADDDALDAILLELLRRDDPFVSNRRVATRDTEVGGCPVAAGDQVRIHWTGANRDPRAVGDPDGVRPERDSAANLVFGAGPHLCPGRLLSLLQLRAVVRAVVGRCTLEAVPGAVREEWPAGGYAIAPVVLADRRPGPMCG